MSTICARGAVAEELAERLLVEGDAVPFDQGDEVALACSGLSAEMQKRGLRRDEVRSGRVWMLVKLQRPPPEMRIFSPGARGMVDHQHRASAPARLDGAHHPGRAGADHHDVEILQGTPLNYEKAG